MSEDSGTTYLAVESVDVDGDQSVGYYVDDEGTLGSIALTPGEALAIHKELIRGADTVGYAV